MTIAQFINTNEILEQTELNKVKLLSYYHKAKNNLNEFTFDNIEKWFVEDLGHIKPNIYRLKANFLKSKDFVKGTDKGMFKLNVKAYNLLETKYKISTSTSEEIITENSILPDSLYNETRGYIISLAKQINAAYEHNICDGCAVLMRRLVEVCLILSYKNLGIESQIQNPDTSFKMLDSIINDAITNSILGLSKDSKLILHDFKELGNFSAHKIYYNCRKSEIEKIARKYRATIEELFYKCGFKI